MVRGKCGFFGLRDAGLELGKAGFWEGGEGGWGMEFVDGWGIRGWDLDLDLWGGRSGWKWDYSFLRMI